MKLLTKCLFTSLHAWYEEHFTRLLPSLSIRDTKLKQHCSLLWCLQVAAKTGFQMKSRLSEKNLMAWFLSQLSTALCRVVMTSSKVCTSSLQSTVVYRSSTYIEKDSRTSKVKNGLKFGKYFVPSIDCKSLSTSSKSSNRGSTESLSLY